MAKLQLSLLTRKLSLANEFKIGELSDDLRHGWRFIHVWH